MLKLFSEAREVQSATIPVRWCIDRQTLEALELAGVKNPHILLVIKKGNHEHRKLAPLDRLVEYVQFQSPGENKVFATIVWNIDGNGKLRDQCLSRGRLGRYRTDVLSYDDELGFYCPDITRREEAIMDVVVPEELFAKEPAAWEKWWVNFWFESRAVDQCHFRKRRLLAYSIQPLAVLLWTVVKLAFRFVVALGLSIGLVLMGAIKEGLQNIDWKPVIHPFRRNTNDIWWHVDTSDSFFVKFMENWIMGSFDERKLREKRQSKERFKQRYEEYQVALCDQRAKPVSVLIPSRYKLYPLFHDLKALLCKPFAH